MQRIQLFAEQQALAAANQPATVLLGNDMLLLSLLVLSVFQMITYQ